MSILNNFLIRLLELLLIDPFARSSGIRVALCLGLLNNEVYCVSNNRHVCPP